MHNCRQCKLTAQNCVLTSTSNHKYKNQDYVCVSTLWEHPTNSKTAPSMWLCSRLPQALSQPSQLWLEPAYCSAPDTAFAAQHLRERHTQSSSPPSSAHCTAPGDWPSSLYTALARLWSTSLSLEVWFVIWLDHSGLLCASRVLLAGPLWLAPATGEHSITAPSPPPQCIMRSTELVHTDSIHFMSSHTLALTINVLTVVMISTVDPSYSNPQQEVFMYSTVHINTVGVHTQYMNMSLHLRTMLWRCIWTVKVRLHAFLYLVQDRSSWPGQFICRERNLVPMRQQGWFSQLRMWWHDSIFWKESNPSHHAGRQHSVQAL